MRVKSAAYVLNSAAHVRANHNCEHLRKTLEEETNRNRDLARDFEVSHLEHERTIVGDPC